MSIVDLTRLVTAAQGVADETEVCCHRDSSWTNPGCFNPVNSPLEQVVPDPDCPNWAVHVRICSNMLLTHAHGDVQTQQTQEAPPFPHFRPRQHDAPLIWRPAPAPLQPGVSRPGQLPLASRKGVLDVHSRGDRPWGEVARCGEAARSGEPQKQRSWITDGATN